MLILYLFSWIYMIQNENRPSGRRNSCTLYIKSGRWFRYTDLYIFVAPMQDWESLIRTVKTIKWITTYITKTSTAKITVFLLMPLCLEKNQCCVGQQDNVLYSSKHLFLAKTFRKSLICTRVFFALYMLLSLFPLHISFNFSIRVDKRRCPMSLNTAIDVVRRPSTIHAQQAIQSLVTILS